MVLTIFHQPDIVPRDIIVKQVKGTQVGKVSIEEISEDAIIAAPIIHITF
jgi:hypothetical protein